MPKDVTSFFVRYPALAKGKASIPSVDSTYNKSSSPKDQIGDTALMKAVRGGEINAVKTILANGADVNVIDEFGYTALMWAVERGHTDIVQVLLDTGANVNAKDEDGWTALMLAAKLGHTKIVNLLKQAGARE